MTIKYTKGMRVKVEIETNKMCREHFAEFDTLLEKQNNLISKDDDTLREFAIELLGHLCDGKDSRVNAHLPDSKEQMKMLLDDEDESITELLDAIDEHVFEIAATFEARCIL